MSVMKFCFLLPFFMVALLGACEGDDGSDGPAGTVGAAGPPGDAGPAGDAGEPGTPAAAVTRDDVLRTNGNIAYLAYGDSLVTVIELRTALEQLVADPTEANLAAAKQAWLASREP